MKRLTPDILFESGHLSQDLARKSVRGGMTTMTAQGVQFVLQLAGTMVLARLLTPNDYGLIGMVTVVVGFAGMFKDAGLSMATVQRDSISHEQISTLFWLNVLLSAFLGLCVLAGSPLVAWFYGRPELTAVTAALSLSFIITGLTIQHAALLRRHMRFATVAVIQIASYVISLVVTILLALAGWRYWALVGGSLATAVSGTLLTLFFCPWIPGRMQRGTGIRGMLKFGGHLTGFNFVNYFSRNADSILIGRFIGADALGLYARAYQLFMLPISQIKGPLDQVAMPVLSSLRNQPDRYVKYYQRLLDIMASLTIPLTMYCIVEADFLIRLLLGPKWLGAVSVFRILAIAGLIQPLFATAGLVQISHGYSQRFFYWGIVGAFVYVSAFALGIPFGIEAVAAFYTIANYVMFVPTLLYCFHKTPVTVFLFMRTLAAPLIISSAAVATATVIGQTLVGSWSGTHLVFACAYAGVIFGAYCLRTSVRETMGLICRASSRRGPKATLVPEVS